MLSKEERRIFTAWCKNHNLNYTINDDGTVDIVGDVNINKSKDGKFPIKFGRVSGNFICNCYNNYKLTTLEGGPTYVGGNYDCSSNELTSLLGAPAKVEGYFDCRKNKLTTLEGGPTYVGGRYNCSQNELTSLQGAPITVKEGYFDCRKNKLTSLAGGPTYVGGRYDCSSNELTSLQGVPTTVEGDFDCSGNKLTSLAGGPTYVGGYYDCSSNELTSLLGAPAKVEGCFDCRENKLSTLQGIEGTTIMGSLYIDEFINYFGFFPNAVEEVTNYSQKIILKDNMDLEDESYIIAPHVRTLGVFCKNTVTGHGAEKTMDLFHLPIRIEMQGTIPPEIKVIEPSSISNLELHVPVGAVDVYSKHKQWKRAFLITDDNGVIVFKNPKNVAKYEEYLAEIAKKEAEQKQEETERSKQEKLQQLQLMAHSALCNQYLAAYKPKFENDNAHETIYVKVILKCGREMILTMPNDCPVSVWQDIPKFLEKFDFEIDLGCSVNVKMTLH